MVKPKKSDMEKAVAEVARLFGIEPDVIVIGIADEEGKCAIQFNGYENKVGCLVNEIMGQAVAKMPRIMHEIMLSEILANGKMADEKLN